jgi:hypothetical protein
MRKKRESRENEYETRDEQRAAGRGVGGFVDLDFVTRGVTGVRIDLDVGVTASRRLLR